MPIMFQVGNVLIPNANYKRLGFGAGAAVLRLFAVDTQQNALTLAS